ncbi:hypothetical protein FPHYL_12968 [Fusarium phyllophilum]|uniref:Uncharacterized protein n=1 Tax=Fusarium phyllophilum TaxID=47803 RepID=A0A8H5MND9_9HYPO|nr:hypothetical protein FPHYL_12968 [Fusarium phyllophilum]
MSDRDPSKPSLEALTDGCHPFSLPWGHDVRVLLGGFKVEDMSKQKGPWTKKSAFEISGSEMLAVVPDTKGGSMSYKDGMATNSETSDDHLSASLGLTVGYPFLNASVTGDYDRNVMESHNVGFTSAAEMNAAFTDYLQQSIRASRNASCRLGRIILDQPPPLSIAAKSMLQSQGPRQFANVYGDYYVSGYELGADAGASLSATTESKESKERLAITVKVKALFFERALPEAVITTSSSDSSSCITFVGYSTLGNSKRSVEANGLSETGLGALQKVSAAFLQEVGALEISARNVMNRLGLVDGQQLSLERCSEVCKSGLVVQLLLAPYNRLVEFVELAAARIP